MAVLPDGRHAGNSVVTKEDENIKVLFTVRGSGKIQLYDKKTGEYKGEVKMFGYIKKNTIEYYIRQELGFPESVIINLEGIEL